MIGTVYSPSLAGAREYAHLASDVSTGDEGQQFNSGESSTHQNCLASWINNLYFLWLRPVIKIAQERVLVEDDALPLPPDCDCTVNREKLAAVWGTIDRDRRNPKHAARGQNESSKGAGPRKSLMRSLIEIYGLEYASLGFYLLFSMLVSLSGPIFLHKLVMLASSHSPSAVAQQGVDSTVDADAGTPSGSGGLFADTVSSTPASYGEIIFFVCCLCASKLCASALGTQYSYQTGLMSLRIGSAISGNLFDKILRLSTQSRRAYTTGQLANLYTTDIERVTQMMLQGHRFWALPVQILITMALLYFVVSYAMLFGLAAIISILVLNRYISKLSKAANDKVQAAKDVRMGAVSACFGCSLVIKLNAWEDKFKEKIFLARKDELTHIWTCLLIGAVNICLLWLAPCVVSTATIASYASLREVRAAEIFTALALFKSLQDPCRDLPNIITQYFQMQTSLERLQKLFYMPEKEMRTILDADTFERLRDLDSTSRDEIDMEGENDIDEDDDDLVDVSVDDASPISLHSNGRTAFQSIRRKRNDVSICIDPCTMHWGGALHEASPNAHDCSDDEDEEKEKEEKLADGSERYPPDMDRSSGELLSPDSDSPAPALSLDADSGVKRSSSAGASSNASSHEGEGGGEDAAALVDRCGFRLHLPKFSMSRGELLVIVGTTGSGKSSFVSALLGDMYLHVATELTESGSSTPVSTGTASPREASVLSVDTTARCPVRLKGRVSYSSQQAWIQNGTLLDNILMGQPYAAEKLQRVIDACALNQDLSEIDGGLSQLIGEKGIGLSGGQRARVALARALYSDADIIIMDDVFAALDVKVGKHVFRKAVTELLKGKTVVLVTHSTDIIESGSVDCLCTLSEGRAAFSRPNSQAKPLVSSSSPSVSTVPYEFSCAPWDLDAEAASSGQVESVVEVHASQSSNAPEGGYERPETTESASAPRSNFVSSSVDGEGDGNDSEGTESEGRSEANPDEIQDSSFDLAFPSSDSDGISLSKRRNFSFHGRPLADDDHAASAVPPPPVLSRAHKAEASLTSALPVQKQRAARKLASDSTGEERAEGNVSISVYKDYIAAMGGWKMLVLLCCIQTFWQCLSVSGDIWLTYWTKHDDDWQKEHVMRNIFIYSALSLGSGCTVFARTYTISTCGFRAAKTLFERMTHAVLYAPMHWLDVNPSGRILNRFSHDMSKVDMDLPYAVGGSFAVIFSALGTLLAVSVITKWLAIIAIPIAFAYADIMSKYIKASREIQRMQQTTQSPVLSFMSEVSAGACIVNAFGARDIFVATNDAKVSDNSQMVFMANASSAWFVVRVQALGGVVLLFICVFAFSQIGGGAHSLGPSLIGLSLSYGLAISDQLQSVVMLLSWFENLMVCPERIIQYCSIAPEGTSLQKDLFQGRVSPDVADSTTASPSESSSHTSANNVKSMTAHTENDSSKPAIGADSFNFNKAAYGDIEMGPISGNPMHSTSVAKKLSDAPYPVSWIKHGKIEFRDVFFRYQPTSEDVLTGLSFTINPGEKVGIVGRTGSGKSTLSMSLFRVAELSSGSIFIDDCDCAEMPLQRLRSAIEIIPQSPVVLKGTVRMNLDPFHAHSDEAVHTALKKSFMLRTISNLYDQQMQEETLKRRHEALEKAKASKREGKGNSNTVAKPSRERQVSGLTVDPRYMILNALLDESGGNLSVGEKQLLVMARALLANAKVLVMDEATANIDNATDQLIQTLLESEFKASTVLTVAHRIHTVARCDRVIVMSAGKVVECAPPDVLKATSGSIFAHLAKEHS